MSYNGVGTLAFVDGNLSTKGYQDILEKNFWPNAAKYFPSEDFIFLDDNAPVHRARSTTKYKLIPQETSGGMPSAVNTVVQ